VRENRRYVEKETVLTITTANDETAELRILGEGVVLYEEEVIIKSIRVVSPSGTWERFSVRAFAGRFGEDVSTDIFRILEDKMVNP